MVTHIDTIRKCPLFSGIAGEDLLRMLHCLGAKINSYDKKDTIMQEGGSPKTLGIILSGSAQIISEDYYGNRSILMKVGEGEIFAEDFACAEIEALPVSIISEDKTEIMFIDCSHILHTCENNCGFHQQLIYNLMKDLAEKSIKFNEKIEVTSKRTTREKILTFLDIQSRKAGSRSFDIPFDRQELADYLEVDRSGLSVEIGKLRKEGVLDACKRRFVLL